MSKKKAVTSSEKDELFWIRLMQEQGSIPTASPTFSPSISPSGRPSAAPSPTPSATPSTMPSASPSGIPSASPSVQPSSRPSASPSAFPSVSPTFSPSAAPSGAPSPAPSRAEAPQPTPEPTPGGPSAAPTISAAPTAFQVRTISQIIEQEERFETYNLLYREIGGFDLLNQTISLTLLAPNNEAFDTMDQDLLNSLLTDPGYSLHLNRIVLAHLVFAVLPADELTDGRTINSFANAETYLVSNNGTNISFLTDAAQQGLPGASPSAIVSADTLASNGIVHELDTVLLPDFSFLLTTETLARNRNENYSIFLDLLDDAGLTDTVNGDVHTVLAPTNEAFGNLDQSILDFLTNPANVETLRQVLLHHLIAGSLPIRLIEELVEENGDQPIQVITLEGSELTISLGRDNEGILRFITFSDADQTATTVKDDVNVLAQNGISHGIDTVLSPFPL